MYDNTQLKTVDTSKKTLGIFSVDNLCVVPRMCVGYDLTESIVQGQVG